MDEVPNRIVKIYDETRKKYPELISRRISEIVVKILKGEMIENV